MAELEDLIDKPLPRKDVIESEELIGQQLFLYDEINGDVHCLNGGAAVIWLLCDGTRDAESISGEIAHEFSLPEQQVLTEVQETLAHLQTLGLLELQASTS